MFEHDSPAVIDGRALRDGSTSLRAYGSYHLATRDGCKQTVCLEHDTATNNEAEYPTLITAPGCESNSHHRVLSAKRLCPSLSGHGCRDY
jgi:hypothetical protein